ncbi:MAG: RNA polymerase sigma factor [Desulfobacterales bacterium]|nr:RNA polymerase sigma factor [Desulfobacterales bacterium]
MQSDSTIVARVLNGDANAFEPLVVRYKAHVMKIVTRHVPYQEAEELAQDIFIRAYTSLPTYKEKSGFKPWLSTVAVRACYDYWRKRYRSKEIPLSELTENHQHWLETAAGDRSGTADEDGLAQKEAREVLDWALARLTAEDRMVLELTFLQGYSGQEAAALLGWSVANVKVRAHRSRKKLKNILSETMAR